MINSVRNTVFSILNKNNYGYISPQDFDLFAKQAQLEIFDSYFSSYNTQINKENARVSGTEYADITKGIEESIDLFSVTKSLGQKAYNKYNTPSLTTTGDDYYLLNKVLIFTTLKTTGTTTSIATDKLIDTSATFTTTVIVGDMVVNTSNGDQSEIIAIDSNTTLTISEDIMTNSGDTYSIYKDESSEAEKISNSKASMLNRSLLTAPNVTYPAYTLEGDSATIYPKTLNNLGQVYSQYIRYPKDPKWTYTTLADGQPVFNQSTGLGYQDFELTIDDQIMLIVKILGYAGMQIRETQVVQFAQAEEIKDNQ
jgi:hypothetical protein